MRCAVKGVLWLLLVGLFAAGCRDQSREEVVLDVRAIANRSSSEVVAILGKPDSVYTLRMMGKVIFCQLYKDHHVEIQYAESLASDIIVYGQECLPFDQTALSFFKLDYREQHPADYRKGSFIRWDDFREFSAISFYNPSKDSLGNIRAFDIFFKVKARP
jgi:hypothetical protein